MNVLLNRFSRKEFLLALVAILFSLLTYFFLPNTIPEVGKRVLAVFILAVFFWAFEIIPLYATSLLIVVLLTFLLTKPGGVLGLGKTGYHLFLVPFSSPVIMLFLGGFILAAGVHKHHVDSYIMQKTLIKLGTRSHVLILGFLFMSAFFSMWISNTAATAMMLILLKPILESIQDDDPAKKGIVLATAFGASIGGVGTPIGTPPNAIAIGILSEYGIELDFIDWMLIGVPLAVSVLVIAAIVLFLFFPPKTKHISYSLPKKEKLTKKGIYVMIVALFIILCWLTKPLHHIPEALIALLGVGLMAGFQLISTRDLKEIDWDILILMWGGLALGEALKISGLIDVIIGFPFMVQDGFGMVASFSILAVILSSFISNTATANLLLPIVVSLHAFDKSSLSITVALACSLALAFPISTPPNAIAYSTGIFKTKEMFKSGGLITVLALILLLFGFKFISYGGFYG